MYLILLNFLFIFVIFCALILKISVQIFIGKN